MYKTKKIKHQPKKKTKKLYRGGNAELKEEPELNNTQEVTPNELSEQIKENKIMEEVKNSSSLSSLMPNLSASNIMSGLEGPISNIKKGAINIASDGIVLAEGLAEKGIEQVGNAVGVDVTHPETIENKLHQIKNIISNPVIKEEIAKIGEVVLESASPYIEPLKEKVIEKAQEVGQEIGKSAVQIALNTADEIPIVGLVISGVRSGNQAAKAALATVNATSEVVKDTADTINATAKNFERLVGEKIKIGDRISNSISEFTNPKTLLSKDNISKLIKTQSPSLLSKNKINGSISKLIKTPSPSLLTKKHLLKGGRSNKKVLNKSKKRINKHKYRYK